MRDAHIFNGDLVLVRVQPQALPGEIVVAMVDDEVTVKCFQMNGKAIILNHDLHPRFEPGAGGRPQPGRSPRVAILI